jgi:phosphate/sulfate permease
MGLVVFSVALVIAGALAAPAALRATYLVVFAVVGAGVAGGFAAAAARDRLRSAHASRTLSPWASGLTRAAVFLAGRERVALRDEWQDHLSGENGAGLGRRQQFAAALGFVRAAVRYRLLDAAELAWRPVDAVLGSRDLSGLVVLLPTLGVSVLFIRQGGLDVLAGNLVNVGAVGGAACTLIRAGRWRRGVKPPARPPRRKRE